MVEPEPQSARDYNDQLAGAVRQTLVEIAQILGSFKGKFAVIGGAVPWLLLDAEDMPHVGTRDIDLALDAEALADTEYADLISALMANGYAQREGNRPFQLVRAVPTDDGGQAVGIFVDFLMPRDAVIKKHRPPIIDDFAVQRADGADLAIHFHEFIAIEDRMPGSAGRNRVEIAVASIPALLGMKGHALAGRLKRKDSYDIYYCVRNYPGGPEALAEACRPLLAEVSAVEGYTKIAGKFRSDDDAGPTWVREFVTESDALGDRSAEEWQTDAFGQVRAWLDLMGL